MESVNNGRCLMSSIKSKEEEEAALLSSIPPGYLFKPKDEELIEFYLKRKIKDQQLPPNIFRDVKLYDHDPETLTAMNNNGMSDGSTMEWYFFTPRDRKYENGKRPSRSAGNGYWKATGKDKEVVYRGEKVGLRKTLVYYNGKPPQGDKTDWMMHEYVTSDQPVRQRLSKNDMRLDDWVASKVYLKLNKRQRPAIAGQSGGQENGIAPLVQHEEFGAGALNMPVKDQSSPDNGAIVEHGEGRVFESGMAHQINPMPAYDRYCDSMLPPCPESFNAMQGQDPAIFCDQEAGFMPMPAPLTTVPLDYQSFWGVSLQQPLSGDGLSNWSHLSPMQQPFSGDGLSNWSHLSPMQQPFSGDGLSNWSHSQPNQQVSSDFDFTLDDDFFEGLDFSQFLTAERAQTM